MSEVISEQSAGDRVSLRNILFANDLSECSARALDYAIGIALRYAGQLHLFHCVDPTPFNLAEDPEAIQTTCDDARRELERMAASLRSRYRSGNLDVKVVVRAGSIAAILPKIAEELDSGLIVVGTHGRTGWRKAALGSVTEAVIEQAPCPVLSIGPSTNRTRIQEFGPRNILLAFSSSNRSERAESYAVSLSRKYSSKLSVVNVFEDGAGRVRAQVAQFECCEAAQPGAALASLQPTEIGTQSDLILRVAERTTADLMVLVVPGNHRFSDRFVSTNSYRVVSGAACPVLTVRAEPEQDWE
jgi:nucleotide-binding universal stress UspA family protein